jgi:SAM-dependent methyltransferase
MNHTFDKTYWDDIWSSERAGTMSTSDPNPHLLSQVESLEPGSAIDAGCGGGAEAIWLAAAGWTVTAADVADRAIAYGETRAAEAGVAGRIQWVQADLSFWQPDQQYDLVSSFYAHPAIPQLEFYRRIATWVGPHGTLLIVGHLHVDGSTTHDPSHHDHHDHHDGNGHGHSHGQDVEHDGGPPAQASATASAITQLLDPDEWDIATAEESQRSLTGPGGRETTIHDVVVRATRRN